MHTIYNTILLLGLSGVLQAEPKSIFNGKDLDGWAAPEGNIWWTAGDGVLTAKSGPKQKGSILWTEKSYRDFEIELDFRSDGDVDSGVFLRTEKEQIQIGISGSLKRDMTASPYIVGKGYPVEAEEKEGVKGVKGLLKLDEWNTMKIRSEGNTYTVWLNGTKVMSYESETAVEEGPVGLQLHVKKEMEIDFRNIRLTEL